MAAVPSGEPQLGQLSDAALVCGSDSLIVAEAAGSTDGWVLVRPHTGHVSVGPNQD